MADFQEKSDSFVGWLANIPGVQLSSRIRLEDFRDRGAGRAVVAVEEIPTEDEDLFTIPRSCLICAENSELPSKLPHVFEEVESWLSLVLVLMYEHLKPNSYWKPYLDILPDSFETLMFWSREEIEQLQASAVVDKIGSAGAEETFRTVILPAIKENKTSFYPAGTEELSDDQIIALAHRMASIVMAYAFDVESDELNQQADEDGYIIDEEEGIKAMVPMADMLNADVDHNARLYQEEGILSMKSLRRIEKGEEILNDYGPLPRSDLIRRYGYLTPNYAKYDVVEIPQELVLQTVEKSHVVDLEDLEERVAYLDDKGHLEDAYLLVRRAEGPFPQNLKAFIMTLIATPDEYRHLDDLSLDRRGDLQLDFVKVVTQVVAKRLQEYATTLAEDQVLLQRGDIKGRKKMAVEIRAGEKEILAETMLYARELLSVDSGEEEPPTKISRISHE